MKRKKRKKTLGIVLLAIVAAAGVLTAARWRVWFHNEPEMPYRGLPAPGRILLTFGDSTALSRNVSWQCGEEVRPSHVDLETADSTLRRRIDAHGETFVSRNGRAAYYVARLPHLQPATRYRYRVVTDSLASAWHTFSTPPSGSRPFEFLYVGDVQDTIHGIANRLLRQACQRHPRTEFLVCGGDLTERPTDQHWAETFRTLDSIGQTLPVLCATGNHDYLKGIVGHVERRFSLVFSYFQQSALGDNHLYTLRYADAQFFLLDSNRELPYLLTQRRWLTEQLERSTARWKILVVHHPLHSVKGNNNLLQRWLFDGVARTHGVDLILQGHEHAYARMTHHRDDGTPTTPVYTVSHCSPKHYRIEFDDRFDKFGIADRYYQHVRISRDTLALAVYTADDHHLYDSLLIVKPSGSATPTILDHGTHIPERMDYTPRPHNRKDRQYADRIADYLRRHPERTRQH